MISGLRVHEVTMPIKRLLAWLPGPRPGTSLSSGEILLLVLSLLITFLIHLIYFYRNWQLGFPSIGVDGEVYYKAALDCIASETLLFEKSNTLFWTPWYVIIALLRADHFFVFGFNLLMKYVATACAAGLSIALVHRRYLRLLPALGWLFYWPTFDYVIFYHYEIALSAVCTAVPFLLFLWFGKIAGMSTLANSLYSWVPLARKPRIGRFGLSVILGVVLGFGIFSHSRLVGLLAIVFVAASFWVQRPFMRSMITGLTVIVTLALLPTIWWGYRNYILYDQWVFSSTSVGYNLYVGYNELAEGYFQPQPPYPPLNEAKAMAIDYIQNNPWRSAGLFVKRLGLFWCPSEAVDFGPSILLIQEYLALPVGILGVIILLPWSAAVIVLRFRGRRIRLFELTLMCSLAVILWFQFFHAVFYVTNPRFRIPVIPLVHLIAAIAVECLLSLRNDHDLSATSESD